MCLEIYLKFINIRIAILTTMSHINYPSPISTAIKSAQKFNKVEKKVGK